jgi:ubiquinone/menaquinone biosynthesis C-methylase UbiE
VTLADRAQRAIGAAYSWTSDKVYERLVVNGGFRLLGGQLNDLVLDQGARAAAAADGVPILDVPVGTAYFTTRMSSHHDGLVVGADLAWGMVAEARRAAQRSFASNLTLAQADIHRLPFKDGSFGAVLCTNGLQVIPDLSGALGELARVLARSGVLMLSVIVSSAGSVLPASAEKRLPTVLRSGRSISEEISGAGLTVVSVTRSRLAYLMEAIKR